jgi:hypothetical protein
MSEASTKKPSRGRPRIHENSNARPNWTMIRVKRSTQSLLKKEAARMLRKREYAADRDRIEVAESGRHKDLVTLDTVILALFRFRAEHKKRRDRSDEKRRTRKKDTIPSDAGASSRENA